MNNKFKARNKKNNIKKVIPLILKASIGFILILSAVPLLGEANEFESNKKGDKKTKYRLYPGGKDEEDLKVQTQLPPPGRRMNIETKATQDTD